MFRLEEQGQKVNLTLAGALAQGEGRKGGSIQTGGWLASGSYPGLALVLPGIRALKEPGCISELRNRHHREWVHGPPGWSYRDEATLVPIQWGKHLTST